VTEWTERSLPQSRRDALGRVTRFEHDRLGRLIRTVHPFAGAAAEERIVYDDRGNTRIQIDAEGRAKTLYDREGRVLRIENAAGGAKESSYDPAGNKILETNWFDATSPRFVATFAYDGASRLIRKSEPLGKVTDFDLDGVGNVIRETLTDASDPAFEPRVNEYDYDALNRRMRTRRDLGTRKPEVVVRYDGNGNKVYERDPLGREALYRYDALNRQIEASEPEWTLGKRKITQALYDGNGNRVEERRLNDPVPQIRRFRFDDVNRLKELEDARRAVTYLDYDAVGNLVREIDPRVAVRLHAYDDRNRRSSTTIPVAALGSPVVTRFVYDRVGNLMEEHQPNGNVVRNTYDSLNRLTSTEDSLGPVGRYAYDARGNRTLEIDANGNRTENFYDALGRLERQELPESRTRSLRVRRRRQSHPRDQPPGLRSRDGLRPARPSGDDHGPPAVPIHGGTNVRRRRQQDRRARSARQRHDLRVRRSEPAQENHGPRSRLHAGVRVRRRGNQTFARDRRVVTETSYDPENHVIFVRRDGLTLRRIEYDANGNRLFETDARGAITGFEHDERNLLTAENGVLAAITRYKLDAMGDRVEERDPEGRTTLRSFDLRRRLERETNGAGETTEYGYDLNGNRTRTRRPEGNEWTFAYDGVNRLESVTDPLSSVTQYGYDPNGNRTRIEDANGNVTTFEYDNLDRLSAMVYADLAHEE
jgi:YD repeat-containing protein